MEDREKEKGASAKIAPFPNTNSPQYIALLNRLARRRLLDLSHTVGPDAELYHAHRALMIAAGWPL